MNNLLIYLIYAAVFVALVIGVEGLWFTVRGSVGDSRIINRRFAQAVARRELGAAAPGGGGALNRWIDRRFPAVEAVLARARAPFTVGQLLLAGAAGMLVVALLLSAAHAPLPIALLAGLAVGVGAPTGVVCGMAARRRKKFTDQMPQAVDLIARSLQAGHPVASSIAVVAKQMPDPIGTEFEVVMQEMTYGLDRDAALHNLVQRFPIPELRMFVASLEVTRESGGNLAEVFLKLSESIRAKAHLRKKVEALSAEGRLSFWIVSALPFVVATVLMLFRPHFYSDVWDDPMFWPLMSIAPVMLTIGSAILWRLVNVKV